jgi:hypothetical protein
MNDETREIPVVPGQSAPPASPWDTLGNWGRTGEVPRPPEHARPWVDAGPPPGSRQRVQKGSAWQVFAVITVVMLSLCVCSTIGVNALFATADKPLTGPVSPGGPAPAVVTSGECDRDLMGEYRVLASIVVENQTDRPATGQVWVRWKLTGEKPLTYAKSINVAPGGRFDFHVKEVITADRWFALGECEHGWTAGKPTTPKATAKATPKKTPAKAKPTTKKAEPTSEEADTDSGRSGGGGRGSRWWR